jgi:predicted ATPase
MFELRAATSLSRYLAARRQPDSARRLLAPLYGRFTEGFDTPDLKQTRAVLEEIANLPADRAAHA